MTVSSNIVCQLIDSYIYNLPLAHTYTLALTLSFLNASSCTCAQVSLRYLLGCFYVNFSPLWPSVAELVASYAVNDYKSVFWDVYTEVMDQVARNAGTYSWRRTTLAHCHVGVLSQCSRGIRQMHLFTSKRCSNSPRDVLTTNCCAPD